MVLRDPPEVKQYAKRGDSPIALLVLQRQSYRLKQSRLAAATRSAGDSPGA